MRGLLSDPKGRAPWCNATGVTLYATGMRIAAFALRGLGGGMTLNWIQIFRMGLVQMCLGADDLAHRAQGRYSHRERLCRDGG